MTTFKLIYTAGPIGQFTDNEGQLHTITRNVARAAQISNQLWLNGFVPIVPHLLSAWEFLYYPDVVSFEDMLVQMAHCEWLERDYAILRLS